MTTPNGSAPDRAFVVGGNYGQDITQQSAMAIGRGQVTDSWGTAQDNFRAASAVIQADIDTLVDGQLELQDRQDLLEGVPGYCSLFMDKNWFVPGSGAILPFNTQLGPAKNAHPAANSIIFERPGLWRADAHLSWYRAQSGWGSSPAVVAMTLIVGKVEAGVVSLYTSREYHIVISSYGPETASFSTTFVVPDFVLDDNNYYYACVAASHNKAKHNVYGGTLRSGLSVNRWGTETDNAAVEPEVPDGGDL